MEMQDLVCVALGILVALVTVVMFSAIPSDKAAARAKIIVALSLVVWGLAGAVVMFL